MTDISPELVGLRRQLEKESLLNRFFRLEMRFATYAAMFGIMGVFYKTPARWPGWESPFYLLTIAIVIVCIFLPVISGVQSWQLRKIERRWKEEDDSQSPTRRVGQIDPMGATKPAQS